MLLLCYVNLQDEPVKSQAAFSLFTKCFKSSLKLKISFTLVFDSGPFIVLRGQDKGIRKCFGNKDFFKFSAFS